MKGTATRMAAEYWDGEDSGVVLTNGSTGFMESRTRVDDCALNMTVN